MFTAVKTIENYIVQGQELFPAIMAIDFGDCFRIRLGGHLAHQMFITGFCPGQLIDTAELHGIFPAMAANFATIPAFRRAIELLLHYGVATFVTGDLQAEAIPEVTKLAHQSLAAHERSI